MFNLSERDARLFSRLTLVLGLAFALSFPGGAFGGILQAMQRYDITNSLDILCSIINTGMTVFFLSRGGGLIALGLITLFIKSIDVPYKIFFILRSEPMLKIDLRLAQKSRLRQIFGYSFFVFISTIAERFRFEMDSTVIGAFLSTGAIAYYSIGAKLMKYYRGMIGSFSAVTTPIFSSMETRDQFESIRSLLMNGTRYLSTITIFVGASLILYGKPFIRLWIGKGYESSYYVMLILAIPQMIDLSQNMSISAVYGIGKHKFPSLVNMGEGALNLGLSIFLVRNYGIYGVALGTALPMLLVKLFIQPIYVCRKTGLSISEYALGLLRPFLIGALYIIIAQWATSMFRLDSYIRLFFVVSASFLFFMIFFIVFCLNGSERKACGQWITCRVGERILRG
jgi:O-antigen/teichoic acid export membrane protein